MNLWLLLLTFQRKCALKINRQYNIQEKLCSNRKPNNLDTGVLVLRRNHTGFAHHSKLQVHKVINASQVVDHEIHLQIKDKICCAAVPWHGLNGVKGVGLVL